MEKAKELLRVFLVTVDDVLENGVKDVGGNFTVSNVWRLGCLEEEREELGPGADGDLDTRDGGDYPGGGMSHKFADDVLEQI